MNNINIALCLSGLSSNYKLGVKTLSNIKQWIKQYDINVDIFIHSWEDVLTQEYINFYNPTDYRIDHIDELDNVIDFFSKKHVTFKDLLSKDFINKIKHTNYTCLSQFYSMSECHKLRLKTGKHYDIVIRSRCDIILDNFIGGVNRVLTKLSKYDNDKKTNCTNILYVPWVRSDEKTNTHTDWCIMLGRPYVFDRIFDLFPYCLNNVPKIDGSEHTIMYNYLVSRNVRVCGNIPLHYKLIRS